MVEFYDMNKKMMRTISCLTVFVLLIALLSGCATWDNFRKAFIDPPEEPVPVIKVGVFEPLTGVDAKDAEDEIAGIELAHELFPNVLSAKIELVYADNKSETDAVPQAIQSLLDENVMIVLGSYGNVLSIAAGEILREANIPAIAVTCTNPLLTQTNPYYARVCYIDSFEARGAADLVYFQMHKSKAGVMFRTGNDYAKAKADEFSNQFLSIVGAAEMITAPFPENETDLYFNATFEAFEEHGIDVIYLPESSDVSEPLIEAARTLGFEFTWIGTNQWEGIQTEGVYYTVDYDPSLRQTAMTETFTDAYHEKYGSDKDPSEATALGFDAYLIAQELLRINLTSNGEITMVEAIPTISGFDGATGKITMDENGDPIKGIVIKQVINGSPVSIYTVTPGREQ